MAEVASPMLLPLHGAFSPAGRPQPCGSGVSAGVLQQPSSPPTCPPVSTCGTAAEQPAQPAAPQRRWFLVLEELQADVSAGRPLDAGRTAALLQEAQQAVRLDAQWSGSGIDCLLSRTLDMCTRGAAQCARQTAVGLLDFHRMVEKYRQVMPRSKSASSSSSSSSSGSGKRSSCADHDGSCQADEACGPLHKRHKGDDDQAACSAAPCAEPQPRPEFAVPHLPAKRPFQHQQHQHQTAMPCTPAPATAAMQLWSGPLSHNINGRRIDYCNLSIQMPTEHVHELGARLQVSQLAPRRSVGLGPYLACKCTLTDASRSQVNKLRAMANNELVAVVPLEHNVLLVVPYFDNVQCLRVVCFLLL